MLQRAGGGVWTPEAPLCPRAGKAAGSCRARLQPCGGRKGRAGGPGPRCVPDRSFLPPVPISCPAAARGVFAASGSRREEAEGPDGLAPAGLGSGTEPLRAAPPLRRRSPPAPPCAMSERAQPGPGAHPGAGFGEPARLDAPRERGESALRARVLPVSSAARTSRALSPVPFPHLQ